MYGKSFYGGVLFTNEFIFYSLLPLLVGSGNGHKVLTWALTHANLSSRVHSNVSVYNAIVSYEILRNLRSLTSSCNDSRIGTTSQIEEMQKRLVFETFMDAANAPLRIAWMNQSLWIAKNKS